MCEAVLFLRIDGRILTKLSEWTFVLVTVVPMPPLMLI